MWTSSVAKGVNGLVSELNLLINIKMIKIQMIATFVNRIENGVDVTGGRKADALNGAQAEVRDELGGFA